MKKRVLATLLSLVMLFSLCTISVMAASSETPSNLTVSDVVAHCHIAAFGQTVDSIELTVSDPSVLNSITADGFMIENASKFVGMIPCAPAVASVEVKDGKLLLTMGGDEFLLYKSDGSEKQGNPLKITYNKDGIQFSFSYADITAENGAIDAMEKKVFNGMNYYSYEPASNEPLPLVVYLHGNALADLQKVALAAVDGLMQPEFQAVHPCYVLAPTSMKNLNHQAGWDEAERAQVRELIQTYIDSGKIDTNRIYITGNSMGAVGTVNMILDDPEPFAAAMPMCGTVFGIADDDAVKASFKENAAKLVGAIPVMIVQAETDPVAQAKHSHVVYDILKELGVDVEAKFYTDEELEPYGVTEFTHAADAMAKYDPALFDWMFKQSKGEQSEIPTKSGLVARADGFYEYYNENGEQVKLDYVKLDDGSLYFFNSKGIGVEIDYTKISEHVIQIFDNTNDSCYIVIGDEKAAIIDGMNGTIDLQKVARFFTDKPLVAVLTHGHGDHTGGVQSFDEVHLNEADFDLYKGMIAGDFRFGMIGYDNYLRDTGSKLDYTLVNLREDIQQANPNMKLIPIADGEVFDLGGISVECIAAPGHTPGSMAMLFREDRVLVTGDAANKYTQVQGYPVEAYLQTLLKLKAREADFDDIYSSHGALLPDGTNTAHMTPNMIDELIKGCESILDGTNKGFSPDPNMPDIPVRWAFEMDATDHRVDGGCGNLMFNINLIRINGKPGTDTPETPDQIPATGDITNLGLWIACAIVSLGAICAVIVSDIRKRVNK